ncbi:MAG: hypothetical protein ACYDCL_19790 [Myxococcales bacterium]
METEGTSAGPLREIRKLREELRDRRSVDHLARAWSSGLAFLLLCGVWAKLWLDGPGAPLYLWPGLALCLAALGYVLRELRRGLRLLAEDRARLSRLRDLEAGSAPPKELF